MSKKVIQFLKGKGIDFEMIKYLHEERVAKFASLVMGFPNRKNY